MNLHDKAQTESCPVSTETVLAETREQFEATLTFCLQSRCSFRGFETHLFVLVAALGCLLVRLFLTARHQRLDLHPYLQDGKYRRGESYAERTVKTAYGTVRYGRTQLLKRKGGSGFYPLDALLGLTRDRLSPWVMQLVGRLATRMSFAAAQLV